MEGILANAFFFVRHGVTDHNMARLVMGQRDIPLNERGREQARRAGRMLRACGIASIVASPLSRASETADIIAAELSLTVTLLDGLKERHWGEVEGRSHTARPWLNAPPAGAESLEDFTARVMRTLVVASALPPVLVVAHSGVCRVLRRSLAIDDGEGRVPNAVPLIFEPRPVQGWRETTLGYQVRREIRSSKS